VLTQIVSLIGGKSKKKKGTAKKFTAEDAKSAKEKKNGVGYLPTITPLHFASLNVLSANWTINCCAIVQFA